MASAVKDDLAVASWPHVPPLGIPVTGKLIHQPVRAYGTDSDEAIVDAVVQGNLPMSCIHHGEPLPSPPVRGDFLGRSFGTSLQASPMHGHVAVLDLAVQGDCGTWNQEFLSWHDAEVLPDPVGW